MRFALIVVLGTATASLGVLLAHGAGLTPLEGYLATSPGGVNDDVLVAAVEIGFDVTCIVAAQVLRIMLICSPRRCWRAACCGSASDSVVGRSSRPARHSSASGTDGLPAQRVGLESRR